MKSWCGRSRKSATGFTLVELLVVLFIMVLLTVVAAPLFSQMLKSSRVEKTVNALYAAFWSARSQAQNYQNNVVGVFFGENPTNMNPQPVSGVVPPQGQIQVWTCAIQWGDSWGNGHSPAGGYGLDWHPYKNLVRPLLVQPITYPDNVRISAGHFFDWEFDASGKRMFRWFYPAYQKSAIGEVKRHHTAFCPDGTIPGWGGTWGYQHSYQWVLVWDETSGEHVVIQAGEGGRSSSTRPRIVCRALTHVGVTNVTNYTKLSAAVDGI